jgi:N-acetylneuraminate synthase
VEFGRDQFLEIDRHCREKGMTWFASCWHEPSVDFIEQFAQVCYKVASASLTDEALLRHTRNTGRPMIISTGISTLEEIDAAVAYLGLENLLISHATSTYPCPPAELNLRMIGTLRQRFDAPIGYSGHEVGLQTTSAEVALGACFVERHITLDRAMWGSDQAASVEPSGFARLVRDVRTIELALGDGHKRVYDSEVPIRSKLRRTRAFN